MDVERLHKSLNSELSPNVKRDELIVYLKTCVNNLPKDDKVRQSIAYNIASLLSTRFADTLKAGDAIDEILILAGELEVSNESDPAKWLQLCRLIERL